MKAGPLDAPLLASSPEAPPSPTKRCVSASWAPRPISWAPALRLLLAAGAGYFLGWAKGSGLALGGVAAGLLGGWSPEVLLEVSATLLSGCFFLSPAVQVAQVCRNRGAGLAEVSPQTMVLMLFNCAAWTAWGVYAPMWPAVPINAFGLVAAACFLAVCWGFVISGRADAPTWGRHAAAGTVAALALIPCCVAYARLSPQRAQHIGDLAMLICILMYASPLSVVRQVIARRSSDLLPPAQCAMQFANCLAWMVVGMNSHATQVLICNGLGFALGVLQLSLLVAFPAAKRGHAPLTEGEQAV